MTNAQQQTKTTTVFETGEDAPSLLDQLLAETHAAGRDTRSLSAEQRAAIVIEISKRLGLNPLTNPVQFLVLNGNKEVLYVTKTATDQIAARHRLNRRTVRGPEVTTIEGVPLLICQVEVTTADGRVEMSTATLPFNKVSLITDVMKVETKAKRRATLSAVGLGLLSEDEIDLIPDAQPSPVNAESKRVSATPATGDKVPSLAALGIEHKGAQPQRKSEPPPVGLDAEDIARMVARCKDARDLATVNKIIEEFAAVADMASPEQRAEVKKAVKVARAEIESGLRTEPANDPPTDDDPTPPRGGPRKGRKPAATADATSAPVEGSAGAAGATACDWMRDDKATRAHLAPKPITAVENSARAHGTALLTTRHAVRAYADRCAALSGGEPDEWVPVVTEWMRQGPKRVSVATEMRRAA